MTSIIKFFFYTDQIVQWIDEEQFVSKCVIIKNKTAKTFFNVNFESDCLICHMRNESVLTKLEVFFSAHSIVICQQSIDARRIDHFIDRIEFI